MIVLAVTSIYSTVIQASVTSSSSASQSKVSTSISVRDPTKYPVCISDSDCVSISEKENDSYACFQYMCYPYTGKDKKHPLRLCKKSSDCTKLSSKEGGDGADGECVRHHNRRQA